MLTRGTMPVLAGMRAVLQVSACWALRDRPPKGLSTAPFDGLQGGQVTWWQTVGERGAIGRAIASEDLRQFEQGSPPTALRDLPGGD